MKPVKVFPLRLAAVDKVTCLPLPRTTVPPRGDRPVLGLCYHPLFTPSAHPPHTLRTPSAHPLHTLRTPSAHPPHALRTPSANPPHPPLTHISTLLCNAFVSEKPPPPAFLQTENPKRTVDGLGLGVLVLGGGEIYTQLSLNPKLLTEGLGGQGAECRL